ncbi:uncharacterized protein K02A2.6 [Trichonephila clavipes]|nr:uncharacterized protein K02A2.6 [Trichonephila clavipes]
MDFKKILNESSGYGIGNKFWVRTVPFALKGRVENKIDRLEKEGIIEKVDSSEWATPVVPVVKSDGSIRLCADYSITLNPNLIVPQHPLPRLDEIFGTNHAKENCRFISSKCNFCGKIGHIKQACFASKKANAKSVKQKQVTLLNEVEDRNRIPLYGLKIQDYILHEEEPKRPPIMINLKIENKSCSMELEMAEDISKDRNKELGSSSVQGVPSTDVAVPDLSQSSAKETDSETRSPPVPDRPFPRRSGRIRRPPERLVL